MRALIFCVLSLISATAFATPNPANMAKITNIEGNGGFPTELVAVTYVRHCSEAFEGAWAQRTSNQVGIAITVANKGVCLMFEPEWVVESVTLPIYADSPTEYFSLSTLDGAEEFSGVSFDSFD